MLLAVAIHLPAAAPAPGCQPPAAPGAGARYAAPERAQVGGQAGRVGSGARVRRRSAQLRGVNVNDHTARPPAQGQFVQLIVKLRRCAITGRCPAASLRCRWPGCRSGVAACAQHRHRRLTPPPIFTCRKTSFASPTTGGNKNNRHLTNTRNNDDAGQAARQKSIQGGQAGCAAGMGARWAWGCTQGNAPIRAGWHGWQTAHPREPDDRCAALPGAPR